jgi:hypothetical protein
MKFNRIELGIKIGTLADEARRIRGREQTLVLKSARLRERAIGKAGGFIEGSDCPDDLSAELSKRLDRPVKQAGGDGEKIYRVIDRIGKKAVRRYLRKGLTKEQILAIPGVQASFRFLPLAANLRSHRKGKVRHESRHSQLALAFLQQRPYPKCEDKPNSYPNWDKIAEIAKRFSREDVRDLMQKFEQWAQEGQSFIRGREILSKGMHFIKEAKFV